MEFSGTHDIAASPKDLWDAIHDPEVLRSIIPGAQEIERKGEAGFLATVRMKLGPVSAVFKGEVTIADASPPHSLTLKGSGEGRGAGLARGEAKVSIEAIPEGSRLSYQASAQVGGKIAQLGQRLVDAAAKRIAGQFFTNLTAHFAAPEEAATEEEAAPRRALGTWIWVGGVVVSIIAAAVLIFAGR